MPVIKTAILTLLIFNVLSLKCYSSDSTHFATLEQETIEDTLVQIRKDTLNEKVIKTVLGIEQDKRAIPYSIQELEEKDIKGFRSSNPADLLTGKIAGVQVSGTASGTGGSKVVTIRGFRSISGSNLPLYVVDGMPIINMGNSSGGLDGDIDFGDGISDINPWEIESITVLKEPNATAVYGSRGSNGVILIDTKKGTKRKGLGVEVNSSLSFEQISMPPEFQNKYGLGYGIKCGYGGTYCNQRKIDGKYYQILDNYYQASWGFPLNGLSFYIDPYVYPENKNSQILEWLPQPYNNVEDFYNTGVVNSNLITLSGGNERRNVRLSLGNSTLKGITPNHSETKYNIKLRSSLQIIRSLTLDTKLNYIHNESQQLPFLGSSKENIVNIFSSMARIVPLDWMQEYYQTTGESGEWPGISYNPYYVLSELKNEYNKDRFIGHVNANLKLTSWLNLTGRFGADIYSDHKKRIWPIGAQGSLVSQGRMLSSRGKIKDFNTDIYMTLTVSSDLFSSQIIAGSSLYRQTRDYKSEDASIFSLNNSFNVDDAEIYNYSNLTYEKEIKSAFLSAQFGYKDYLFFDISGRNEWTVLGGKQSSNFYPSIGTSFIFTDFLPSLSSLLSLGKIRFSWAESGNDADSYLSAMNNTSFSALFNSSEQFKNNHVTRNPTYKNELTKSWEYGADLNLFKNNLGVNLTFYNSSTSNLLVPININPSGESTWSYTYGGKIENKGFELTINSSPFPDNWKVKWNISLNYAKNKSMLNELTSDIESYQFSDTYPNDIELRKGEAFGSIIGYAAKRAPDGQLIVGESGGYIRESKTSILGNINPDWIGGLNNTVTYKGLSLSFLLDFVQGGELSSATKYSMTGYGTGKFTEEGRRPQFLDDSGNHLPYVGILDGVVEIKNSNGEVTGYEENTKAVDGQTYWAMRAWGGSTDWFVLDASYIMLREVVLNYTFKPEKLAKTPLEGLSISLIGRNLFYLEEHMEGLGISPESAPNTSAGAQGIESFSLPPTRTIGMSVSLQF